MCDRRTSRSLVMQNGSGSGQVPETIAPMKSSAGMRFLPGGKWEGTRRRLSERVFSV